MKILGIQRVEFVLADPASAAESLNTSLGLAMRRSETDSHGVVSYTDFAAGIELAGPSRADSPLQALLDQKGEGFLTVVFRVESADAVVSWAKANGIDVLVDLDTGIDPDRYASYRQVSLDPARFPAGMSFTFAEYTER